MAHLELEPLRRMGFVDLARSHRHAAALKDSSKLTWVGDLLVEVRTLASCRDIIGPWRELAQNACQPNVFFEPDFLLSAVQHLPEAAGHMAMLVWDPRPEGEPRLLAFWPMRKPKIGTSLGLAYGLVSRFASSGAPLLHRDYAVEAACALLACLAAEKTGPAGALFNEIALDGPAARALRAAATLSGLVTSELGTHVRACIWNDTAGQDVLEDQDFVQGQRAGGAKLRKDMGRMAKGLSKHGDVRLLSARSPDDIKDGMELFLALEGSGWKARRGTAILSDVRDAAFFRCLSRALGRQGQMTLHLLEAGHRVASTGLVLTSGDHAWYVKTSHDEALARYSPGALLSHQLGLLAQATPSLHCLDSCALPGHQMIEKVWKGRMRVGDLVIGLTPKADTALWRERLARRIRLAVKRVYYRLRGWSMQGQ
jgi:Acetyltransferase (GNAT) domain